MNNLDNTYISEDENIKLYNGDCLELMTDIPDKSVDMILCDLPYGTTSCSWDIIIPFDKLWNEYKRIINDGGVIALFGSQPFTSQVVNSNINWFKNEIIWEKEQGVNFLLANKQPLKIHENILIFGKPTSESKNDENKYMELRMYFKEIHEKIGLNKKQLIERIGQRADHCFRFNSSQWSPPTEETYNDISKIFNIELKPYKLIIERYNQYNEEYDLSCTYNPQMTKGKPYTSGLGDSGDVSGNVIKIQTKNEGTRYPTSIIKFNRETGLHPTQKPVALCEYLINTYSNENDLVLDNCLGSGSTGIASMNTNRKFIGMELDNTYFNIAKERIINNMQL